MNIQTGTKVPSGPIAELVLAQGARIHTFLLGTLSGCNIDSDEAVDLLRAQCRLLPPDDRLAGALEHNIVTIDQFGAAIALRLRRKDVCSVLWRALGQTPVSDDGLLESAYGGFPAGTCREDVWQWFESQFDLSVAEQMGVV